MKSVRASWLLGSLAGVALKTVDADCRVRVATLAKIAFIRDAMRFFIGVTGNALLQAELPLAVAPAQRVVTLVLEHLHVVAPHEGRICYTGGARLGCFNFRLQATRRA
jgi:hypothetical protein